MPDRKNKLSLRREQILRQLHSTGRVSVSALSSLLGATEVTVRSDLSALEQEGLLLRVQGGAVALPDPQSTSIPRLAEKQAIAAIIREQVRSGDTLFINSGTTSLCVAQALKAHQNLNIVTNSLAVATELGDIGTFRVLLLGGLINAQYGFTYGSDAQEQLSQYQADWAILSVDGISARGGLTTYHAEEAILDRIMMDGAKQTLIAADHSKLGHMGFTRVRECDSTMILVTDRLPDTTDLPLQIIC